MQVFALVANFCPLPTRGPHCRTARMSSNTFVCLIRLLIVILSLLVLVSGSNLIAGSSDSTGPSCGTTDTTGIQDFARRRRRPGTRLRLRRGWPTANRRWQPRARQRSSLPCAIFRAHGKPFRRVFFKIRTIPVHNGAARSHLLVIST